MQIVKKNENRIPHRLTQSVDSDEKDIAMTVWNKHKSLGFLLSKVIACMLRKIRTCFFKLNPIMCLFSMNLNKGLGPLIIRHNQACNAVQHLLPHFFLLEKAKIAVHVY